MNNTETPDHMQMTNDEQWIQDRLRHLERMEARSKPDDRSLVEIMQELSRLVDTFPIPKMQQIERKTVKIQPENW